MTMSTISESDKEHVSPIREGPLDTYRQSTRQNSDDFAAKQAVALSPADTQERTFKTPAHALHPCADALPSPVQPFVTEGYDIPSF